EDAIALPPQASAAAPQQSAGMRNCWGLCGSRASAVDFSGVDFNQVLSLTVLREQTDRRAPMRELPRLSRRPNHGAESPATMVSSHSEISASSTAVELRSTP